LGGKIAEGGPSGACLVAEVDGDLEQALTVEEDDSDDGAVAPEVGERTMTRGPALSISN